MDIYELSNAELCELKGKLMDGDHEIGNLTDEELEIVNNATCGDDIPDKIVYSAYSGYYFVKEDFFCNMED